MWLQFNIIIYFLIIYLSNNHGPKNALLYVYGCVLKKKNVSFVLYYSSNTFVMEFDHC